MSPFPRLLTVGELVAYLREVLRTDPVLSDVWVRGEVCNLSRSAAGHFFFSIKDDGGLLRCVLFRGQAARLRMLPQAGDAVLVHGAVNLYEASGMLELIVDLVQPEGTGLYQLQFEALKLKLEAEGLFEPERKRPLPLYPRRIGVVTSDGGAVIHDILTVLGRRYPLAEVVFVPSPVQGEGAVEQLVAALRRFDALSERGAGVDLVILARGGGSPEELAPFNDERLARAIFASRAPVISAVGHETDFTIADLVADLRAPTPSAAAELATPDAAVLARDVRRLAERARALLEAELATRRGNLMATRDRLLRHSPRHAAAARRQQVADLLQRGETAIRHQLRLAREQLHGRALQLDALDPSAVLGRGYSLCYAESGAVLTDAAAVGPGERIGVQLHRGSLVGAVLSTSTGPARADGPAGQDAAAPPQQSEGRPAGLTRPAEVP